MRVETLHRHRDTDVVEELDGGPGGVAATAPEAFAPLGAPLVLLARLEDEGLAGPAANGVAMTRLAASIFLPIVDTDALKAISLF